MKNLINLCQRLNQWFKESGIAEAAASASQNRNGTKSSR